MKRDCTSLEIQEHQEPLTRDYADDGAIEQPIRSNNSDAHGESSVSIHVHDLDRWVSSFTKKLRIKPKNEKKSSSSKGSCSIHKVPDCFPESLKNAYMPQVVSIGPAHWGKESLQAMEEHKFNYVRDVITWNLGNGRDSMTEILKEYMIAVQSVEKEARDCYSETIHVPDINPFIEMMVVDGCFIIALLWKAAHPSRIHKDDPIFKMGWLMSKLQNDLLMLENQIPFIVLQRLFDMTNFPSGHDRRSLDSLALDFFKSLVPGLMPSIDKVTKEGPKINDMHLLYLFRSSLLPAEKEDKPSKRNACFQLIFNLINAFKELVTASKKAKNEDKNNEREAKKTGERSEVIQFNRIHSTRTLKAAGIKFKKVKAADSLFDVKFNNGKMEIPTFVIHGATNSLFLNLIAFEQCYSNCTNHFTDYTAFMNCLVNSADDVETLRQSGIVENWLGSDKDVAHLFKMLGEGVAISTEDFYLSNVFKDVHQYCQSYWNACKASLKRDYFSNPWSIISFSAAIILLALTLIQTFFGMYSYFRPPKNSG